MKKQTKRSKKFQASGGVKKRLQKGGTVTKHGKVKVNNNKRKGNNGGEKDTTLENHDEQQQQKLQKQQPSEPEDDFLGTNNIGTLDIDSFFDQLSDRVNNVVENNDDNEDENDDDYDDDDDDNDNEDSDTDNDEAMDDDDKEDDDDPKQHNTNNKTNNKAPIAKSPTKKSDSEQSSTTKKNKKTKPSDDDDDNDGSSSDSTSDSDDDDDDDDDDDIDAAEAKMKAHLAKMQQSDPDFHNFLKENEQSLLEFGDDDNDDDNDNNEIDDDNDDDDDDEDMEDAEEEYDSKKKTTKTTTKDDKNDSTKGNNNDGMIVLTAKLLNELKEGTFEKHSIKSLKKIITAYKCACHLSDPDSSAKKQKYTIDSSKVFDDLMVLCLTTSGTEFRYHLLDNDNTKDGDDDDDNDDAEDTTTATTTTTTINDKPIKPNKLERNEQWGVMKSILTTFFQSTIHLLSEAKDPQLLAFVLKSVASSIPFLTPFPKLADQLLKVIINLWSTAAFDNESTTNNNKNAEQYQLVRLNAFFRIRQLALTQPYPFLDTVLKKVYLAYAKRCKFSTAGTSSGNVMVASTQTFLGNCVVEIYNLDYHSSYQHAFVYIRQLALLLRSAIQKKTPEEIRQVFCWQYMYCLKVWVAVLCSAAAPTTNQNDDGTLLKSLIYPLTEIILGTIRLAPNPIKYLPARFLAIRYLHQLAAASTTFIPTASLILDCFDYKEWYLVPKKINTKKNSSSAVPKEIQLPYLFKLPGKVDYLRYREQLEPCMQEMFVLLQHEIELYKYTAGFPEYSIRIVTRLRQLNKMISKNARWRTYGKGLLEQIDKYSKDAVVGRSKLLETPKDVKRLECLLPMGSKTMSQRYDDIVTAEQKQLEALRAASSTSTNVTKTNSKNQNNDDSENDDNDDSDNEDDDEKKNEKQTKNKNRKKQSKKAKIEETNKKTNTTTSKKIQSSSKTLPNDDDEADQVMEGIDWSDDDE